MIQKLAQFQKDGKPVPWVRIYRANNARSLAISVTIADN
jgi:hypothetical protein